MAGVRVQVPVPGRAHHRRAVRRHRPQTRPEAGLPDVTALREQVGNRMLQRRPPWHPQALTKAGQFRRPSHADPIAKARDPDLVGLIHYGRNRRRICVHDGHGQGVALHRIHRQVDP